METVSFPAMRFPHLEKVTLPRFGRARLSHPSGKPVEDVPGRVRAAITTSKRLGALPKGASVAVGLGSRGIAKIDIVARAVIDTLKDMGLDPFIVPAMGSHGGGRADSQKALLEKLGLGEAAMGVPIRATMEVVEYGRLDDGTRCCFDANAAQADAVVVVNRVKSHTSFDRPVESGLTKMVAVGLGKAEGARNVHRLGPRGLSETLPALAQRSIERSPLAFGIAVVEDAHKNLVELEGVEPENFMASDERLLKIAKGYIARLPFQQLDTLIVEKIGKNISGTGMDQAVTGRADLRGIANPDHIFIHKIAVLGLTAETNGNGLGVGIADFTTKGVVDEIDLRTIYMNSLTSTMGEKSRIPIVLPTDRDAVAASIVTSWSARDEETRACIIRSTLHLQEILVSEAMAAEMEERGIAVDPFEELVFDEAGRLLTRVYAEENQAAA